MRKLIILATFTTSLLSQNIYAANTDRPACLPKAAVNCSTGYFGRIPPVSIYDDVFESACVQHDFCYRFGSDTYGYSRKACDKKFRKHMRKICKSPTFFDFLTLGSTMAACFTASEAYYGGVRVGGKSAYKKKGKGEYCPYILKPKLKRSSGGGGGGIKSEAPIQMY